RTAGSPHHSPAAARRRAASTGAGSVVRARHGSSDRRRPETRTGTSRATARDLRHGRHGCTSPHQLRSRPPASARMLGQVARTRTFCRGSDLLCRYADRGCRTGGRPRGWQRARDSPSCTAEAARMPGCRRGAFMSLPRCATPVPFTSLVDYWLGETTGVDEEQLDEHLLGCDACSQRLQGIAELAGGVRALARRGVIPAIVSGPLLERLTKEGIKVREYPVEPNGSVNCTVAPEDDLLVARLRASLAGVARLDLILIDLMQPGETRLCEIPFNPRADAVLEIG